MSMSAKRMMIGGQWSCGNIAVCNPSPNSEDLDPLLRWYYNIWNVGFIFFLDKEHILISQRYQYEMLDS
jgi:hypothetical protein